MRIRISDLMDACRDDTVELSLPPEVSPERIRALTMERYEKRQTKKRRLLPRLLLCAALAGALTVSAVGVARTLGAGDIFAKDYAGRGTPLSENQKELISQMGSAGLTPAVSNGATLTPLAVMADEQVCYLRLRIEAPEGTVLPDLDPETEGHYQLSGMKEGEGLELLYTPPGEHTPWGWTLDTQWLPDDDPGDNVKDVVLIFHSMAGRGLVFNDGAPKTLQIHGLWAQSPDKGYTRILDGLWEFDVGLYFESKVVELDAAGLEHWNEQVGCTVTLEELSISPLSLSWRISYPPPTGRKSPGAQLRVVMKDGGAPAVSGGPGERGETYATGCDTFDTPIDLDQVDYILFGDQKIEFPQ